MYQYQPANVEYHDAVKGKNGKDRSKRVQMQILGYRKPYDKIDTESYPEVQDPEVKVFIHCI